MERVSQLNEWVIPQLASSGCFGMNCEITYKDDTNRSGKDQFSSTVKFLELLVKSMSSSSIIKVVVKLQSDCQMVWDVYRIKEQFQNELNMYSKIFPSIDKDGIINELICKYYHGVAETSYGLDKDFLVLEDLSDQGYRLSSDQVFLDYEHCAIAMKAIGRFHGVSYAAKQKDMNKFLETVSILQNKWEDSYVYTWRDMFYLTGKRGVLPLIEANKSVNLLKAFLKNYEDPLKFYNSLFAPEEPEAVLCHGDFNRNNILFLYDETGRPVSVKLFDFQTPVYASPVTDLSFFLFMNTTQKLRDKHWEDLIHIYYEGVKSVVPDMAIPELNFKKFAISGYIICSFFLPFMASVEKIDLLELMKLKPYDQAVEYTKIGGERGTQLLVDIINHLVEKDYIQASYY